MNYFNRYAILAWIAMFFSACSSSNTVSSADPSVNFGQIKTYGFVAVQDTDGKEYQSLETGYLRTAVARELDVRGMSQSDNPDVLINFSIQTKEKIVSRPTAGGSYGGMYDPYYDAYYDDWGMNHQTRIDQYTEGKLNIDLIDPQARKMVWQGSTSGRLTQKDYENAQQTLNEAVTEIFTQFPIPAPEAAGAK
jgi:hypothetical protein